jgi:trans-2-enoyl-CoA reductase
MTKGIALTYTAFNPEIEKAVAATEYNIDVEAIGPNQVALQALATPVNPSDLLQIKGFYTQPREQELAGKKLYIGGNEGLFKVVKLGSAIKGFTEGDWVIPLLANFGTWRTHAIVDFNENDTTKVPLVKVKDATKKDSKITLAEAATISVNPPTAYQLLKNYVTFDGEGKDWVIQNAGASQVSKFVLQLAKVWKINVISVVRGGKPNQKEIEDELLSLGATKVITEEQSQSEEYQKKVIPGWVKETGGRLKLALNSVGGKLASALVQHLSQDGFLVSYGQMDPEPISYLTSLQLFKNLTTAAYWLTKNTKENPQSKVDTVNSILELYEQGKIKNVDFTKVEYKLSDDVNNFFDAYKLAIANSSKHKQVVVYK